MDKVTQSNAAVAEESASAAEELAGQANAMGGLVQELMRLVGIEGKAGDAAVNTKAMTRTSGPVMRLQGDEGFGEFSGKKAA